MIQRMTSWKLLVQLNDETDSWDEWDETETESDDDGEIHDPLYKPKRFKEDKSPEPVTGPELRDLVKNMKSPKDASEFLAAFLKTKCLLLKGVKITQFRHRNDTFKSFFEWDASGTFLYCNDINRLFKEKYSETHNLPLYLIVNVL